MKNQQINDIVNKFLIEFQCISSKFEILKIPTNETVHFKKCDILIDNEWIEKEVDAVLESNIVAMPGVYVIWKDLGEPDKSNVIKVGRHLENSRFRAFQHLSAKYPTFERISNLEQDPESKIILFNLHKKEDKHWAAAVEIFLEEQLSPIVKSKRKG